MICISGDHLRRFFPKENFGIFFCSVVASDEMKATASEINFFIQIFSLHFGLSHTTLYAESSLEVSRIYFCLRHREENVDKNVNMMG